MFPATPAQWAHLLGALGVKPSTAASFAEPCAEVITVAALGREDALDDLLAEGLYESSRFERMEESLLYSPQRIRDLGLRFGPGSRWARAAAQAYDLAGHPEALAEVLYGGRFGNVNPGDGWKYRGRGLPQITFAANYGRVGRAIGLDLLGDPDQLLEPRTALRAFLAWWRDVIPDAAINHDERVRQLVSGGELGLDDVRRLAALARANLPQESTA